MNEEQVAVWRRIESAPLVGLTEDERFMRKLAEQNGWTRAFTERCVGEYRKFAFLAVQGGHPVSPPDAVDQVWHLHLTYTVAYWKEFCPKVLGRPLHHMPSRGGDAEVQKLQDWYERTLASYRKFFGEEPGEIWPDASRKCDEDRRRHQRVDTARYWIVPKPARLTALYRPAAAGLLLCLLLGCVSVGTPDAPSLDWNMDGPRFLQIYGSLLAAALFISILVRRAVRGPLPEGAKRPKLSCYE